MGHTFCIKVIETICYRYINRHIERKNTNQYGYRGSIFQPGTIQWYHLFGMNDGQPDRDGVWQTEILPSIYVMRDRIMYAHAGHRFRFPLSVRRNVTGTCVLMCPPFREVNQGGMQKVGTV